MYMYMHVLHISDGTVCLCVVDSNASHIAYPKL